MRDRAAHHRSEGVSQRRLPPGGRWTLTPPGQDAAVDLETHAASVVDALSIDDGFGIRLRELAVSVGGAVVLDSLHDRPLPSERLDLTELAVDDRERVAAVLASIDRFATRFIWASPLDEEHHTIISRLLRRILVTSSAELRRPAVDRVAAALVWLTLYGNGELRRGGRLSATLIWDWFGVSDASALGRRLHGAAALRPIDLEAVRHGSIPTWLGDVELLHSRARRRLIAERDAQLQVVANLRARRAERAALRPIEGGLAITADAVVPRWALRAPEPSGRQVVVVACGDGDDPTVLGFTVPDAYRLVQMLQRALAAAC